MNLAGQEVKLKIFRMVRFFSDTLPDNYAIQAISIGGILLCVHCERSGIVPHGAKSDRVLLPRWDKLSCRLYNFHSVQAPIAHANGLQFLENRK